MCIEVPLFYRRKRLTGGRACLTLDTLVAGRFPALSLSGLPGIRFTFVPRMMKKSILATSVFGLILGLGGCGGATQTSTPPPVTTPTPTIVLNAPVPASPADGTASQGWPTL